MQLKDTGTVPSVLDDLSPPTAVVAREVTVTTQPEHLISSRTLLEQEKEALRYPRPLYFAYGSNLSFTQMRMRCTHDPDVSAKPIAIASLDGWRWLICQRGYANVVPPAELRIGKQLKEGDQVPVSGEEDAIYGVLYEMTPPDEYLLDGYEGVDHSAPTAPADGKVDRKTRPREQGEGAYNKWYLPATVTEWLDEKQRKLRDTAPGQGRNLQTVLVYVDEDRVRVGPPKEEYIGRMNRAIREADTIGFPKHWADEVMRKFIPRS